MPSPLKRGVGVCKKLKKMNRFKQTEFTEAVKEKMFSEMALQKRRIGMREFAKIIDISPATLCRIENGKKPDIETFFKLCFWMKTTINQFYNSNPIKK